MSEIQRSIIDPHLDRIREAIDSGKPGSINGHVTAITSYVGPRQGREAVLAELREILGSSANTYLPNRQNESHADPTQTRSVLHSPILSYAQSSKRKIDQLVLQADLAKQIQDCYYADPKKAITLLRRVCDECSENTLPFLNNLIWILSTHPDQEVRSVKTLEQYLMRFTARLNAMKSVGKDIDDVYSSSLAAAEALLGHFEVALSHLKSNPSNYEERRRLYSENKIWTDPSFRSEKDRE